MVKKLSWSWKLFAIAAILAAMPLREAAAQGVGVLRGVVLDSVSQQPVAGAQVQLVGTNRAVATDASGVYSISGVPEGPATLRVQRIGYAQTTIAVNASGGGTVIVTSRFARSSPRYHRSWSSGTGRATDPK